MCAIAGLVNISGERPVLDKMLATMKKRGPDDSGVMQMGACTLLHSRLTVIDPEGGRQPMELHFAGETYTIVYNGELYNTEKVRRELLAEGHVFKGYSDTEVVLHAYAQWGAEALGKLNGIFAFGVWHSKAKKLFLARDRMGVKPLFYALHENGIVFSSEIKTILCVPEFDPQLDAQGAAQIILLGPGRIPGSGVFRGICELEPGCCGYFDGQMIWRRYWRLTDREHTQDIEETAQFVRHLVLDAVRSQLVSDVKLGTFLSGGLDSSIISAIAASELAKLGERLPTFSLDYLGNDTYFTPSKFQPSSDNGYIRIMERALDSVHKWTVLTPEMLLDALEDATQARDLPGMADVDFSLLAFCREIRKDVTVALSGECADEIFGGYPWFRDPKVRGVDGFPWAQNTTQRGLLLAPWIKSSIDPEEFVQDHYRTTLEEADILPGTSPEERRMKQMVHLNYRWFMQTLLDRKDRMSMYSGLEVRVPFCDYRIAQYMYGVPWEFKDWQGREKGLLRKAMEGILPEQVLYRKKSPYPKTYDPRYADAVRKMLQGILDDSNAPIFSIIDRKALECMLGGEYSWPWYGQLMGLPQTMAYMLQINYWLSQYKISII